MTSNGTLVLALGALLQAWGPPSGVRPPASIFEPGPLPPPGEAPRGSLDKEIIRGVIRKHIDQVTDCYEKELTNHPDLFGRVMVLFTIGPAGSVVASDLQKSTIDHAQVETCVVQAVSRLKFPEPVGKGIVIVSYPFVFVPERPFSIPSAGADSRAVEITAIDATILVHRSTNAEGVPSNGLIVITDDAPLLVDTAWTEPQTESILRWGRARFKRPWTGAVITHDHPDRAGGLGALARRKIPIGALDLTVAKLAKRGVAQVTALFSARGGAFQDPRGFEAFYPGPGHATDNIVIRVGQVLFGGCLLKSPDANDLGFTGDADLAAWPASVRKVSDRYGNLTIVPGHGVVDSTGAAYQRTLELLQRAARR